MQLQAMSGSRVIGKGEGLAVWPRRVGSCWFNRVQQRIPQPGVLGDVFDDVGIIDERKDTLGGVAVGALKRIEPACRTGKCQCRGG